MNNTSSFPSIISRDCCGGFLYKKYNQPYTSPTVGLYMSNDDFLRMCLHLKEYMQGLLVESSRPNDFNHPVGILSSMYGPIKIHFLHYHSFDEARSKWMRRCSRVDYERIRVICDAKANIDIHFIQLFATIPYKKILLSSNMPEQFAFCHNMDCYHSNPELESLIQHTPDKSCTYLEEVDWNSFLED